jgi:hypothetical protein
MVFSHRLLMMVHMLLLLSMFEALNMSICPAVTELQTHFLHERGLKIEHALVYSIIQIIRVLHEKKQKLNVNKNNGHNLK